MLKERQHLKVGNRYISRRFIGNKKVFENYTDKTEVLSGNEIFSDQADEGGVVHVEVDGKSYQKHEPSPDNPAEIYSLNNVDVVSSVGGRNLFLNSNQIIKMNGATAAYIPTAQINELKENVGGQATISFNIKIADNGISRNMIVYHYQGSGLSINIGAKTITPTAKSQRVSFTGTIVNNNIPAGYSDGSIIIYDRQKNYVEVTNVKIELGDKTPHSPAPEDVPYDTLQDVLYKTNLLLDEPLRSVGDVKDRLFRDSDGLWKVERNVGEYKADGSENWIRQSDYAGGYRFDMSSRTGYPTTNDYVTLINSHFIKSITNEDDGINKTWIVEEHPRIVHYGMRTVAELKNWLKIQYEKGTPVTWTFSLATPTIGTLSDDQQQKLNNIQSYKDSNYVYTILDKSDILSDKLKPTLHATFKSEGWYEAFKNGEVK